MTTRTRTAAVKTAAATPARTARARKTTAAAPVEPKPTTTRTPRKRTAPAKVAEPVAEVAETAKPTRSRKSASTDDTIEGMTKNVIAMIESGALDGVMALLDNAVGARIEFFAEQAKKDTAAKRAATRAANKNAPAKSTAIAEKLAPVTRAKKTTEAPESASASVYKVGAAYVVAGIKSLHGAKVKFLGYVDETGARAKVELREDYTGADGTTRPKGKKLAVPSARLMDGRAFARMK